MMGIDEDILIEILSTRENCGLSRSVSKSLNLKFARLDDEGVVVDETYLRSEVRAQRPFMYVYTDTSTANLETTMLRLNDINWVF